MLPWTLKDALPNAPKSISAICIYLSVLLLIVVSDAESINGFEKLNDWLDEYKELM